MSVIRKENRFLGAKYRFTSRFYDLLHYPWERQYRKWRPGLLADVSGTVLEAGVGTGRNLPYYRRDARVTGIDLSPGMLKRAARRSRSAVCTFHPVQEDATTMTSIPANNFDWLISTYLCCVMPDELQPFAIEQFERVLKPGGRFRLLEMVYSNDPERRRRQERFAPFVERVFGARFDRDTLAHLKRSAILNVTRTYYLKADVYLVIEGVRTK